MKKLVFLIFCAATLRIYSLPTYEPFTEFGNLVATNGSNMVCTANGVVLDQATSGTAGVTNVAPYDPYLTNCIDFSSGGLTDPMGEPWTTLNFAGTNLNGLAPNGANGASVFVVNGLDVAIIQDLKNYVFPNTSLSSLLPSTFPGFPPPGTAITNMIENASQPAIIAGTNKPALSPYMCGNSAVLNFSQDITRPTNGTKTIYVSYLLNVAQQGQLGAGNVGRYLAFICQSNLTAGVQSTNSYTYWAQMFNTFNTTTAPRIAYHGLLLKTAGSTYYIGGCDSSAGKPWSTSTGIGTFGSPLFVVGAYQMSASGNDTNFLWADPAVSSFGGPTPQATGVQVFTIVNHLPDIAGMVFISRTGIGAAGGVGTNYIANLIIGTTWSYVTGGPEFTNQPVNVVGTPGGTVAFNGNAVAAGQSVSYRWQHVVNGTTNVLTDGVGTAGGGAAVSGSGSNTLTLTGVTAGDIAGSYQLVATASGTGFSLDSDSVSILTDPFINSNPANANLNYGGMATFTATASTGYGSMSYRWYFGSIPLVDGVQSDGSTVTGSAGTVSGSALSTTLTVSNVSYLEAGNYYVVVTNNANNANASSSAVLSVNDPYLISQPNGSPLVLTTGGSGSISVSAAGTGVTYQWYGVSHGLLSNGGDLSGVGTATLSFANAQASDADNYYCVVSGTSGQTVTTLSTPVYVESAVLGPFNQNDWPPTYAPNASVDYAIWDPNWTGTYPGAPWNNVLTIAPSSGDQTWTAVTIGGGYGYQMTGSYLSIQDPNWKSYTNVPGIDILLNVYGNGSFYDANGNPLATTLREGQTTTPPSGAAYVKQGAFPLGANNGQWNWVLLTFTNPIDGNGYRYVGDPIAGTGKYGGVNNSTVSLYGGSGGFGAAPFIVRAVAMGPHGAFGTADQINRFQPPANCPPEPTNNLAWIDFNQGASNNLSVMNNPGLGETYTVVSGVGPVGDQRTAIQPSSLMEMPILNNYLGYPCNENLSCQVCFEVYDDPALVGSSFGPYEYATDYQGDLAPYNGSPYTFTGSGKWIKVCFFVGPLSLNGVNTAPLTGGPLIQFNGTLPYIDRVEVGLIRTGTNALAGQIPDPDYHINPFICDTNYGYFAEWNPTAGINNTVDIASGYTTTLQGPAGDQRICEQPVSAGGGTYYEDWALLNQVLGPNLQDNADVIMSLTYYDDPALAGATLFPNVYSTLQDGNLGVISPSSPYGLPITLQGSGKWKQAQFELPNVNFQNGSVQHVCRFASSGPVYVSRVRFNVLRPCGDFEGIDYLQSLGVNGSNAAINLNWRGQATLQGGAAVSGTYGPIVTVTNTITNVYTQPTTNAVEFFRLQIPGYPPYLPGNTP